MIVLLVATGCSLDRGEDDCRDLGKGAPRASLEIGDAKRVQLSVVAGKLPRGLSLNGGYYTGFRTPGSVDQLKLAVPDGTYSVDLRLGNQREVSAVVSGNSYQLYGPIACG